jgi:hypothetical protein
VSLDLNQITGTFIEVTVASKILGEGRHLPELSPLVNGQRTQVLVLNVGYRRLTVSKVVEIK